MKRDIPLEQFGRVALLMGGWSVERAVSLRGGAEVLRGLHALGVDAVALDVESREALCALDLSSYDRAFLMMHGEGGEDGLVQSHLELLGVPYTGSGVLSSALAMDKCMIKQLWRGLGVSTPDWVRLTTADDCALALERLGLPLVIKPVVGGSSLGVVIVREIGQLEAAFATVSAYGAAFAERYIQGRELTVSLLGGEPLPVLHIETPHEFYDYDAKYIASDTVYHCPADLPAAVSEQCQQQAKSLYQIGGLRDWGRFDFICDQQDHPWVIECNTIPGMTTHSLFPAAAAAAGYSLGEQVGLVLTHSLERV